MPDAAQKKMAGLFASNLKYLRKRADLSQEKLAALADLHRTEIGQLEKGERLPTLGTLIKLGGALEIDPDRLLSRMTWDRDERRFIFK